MPRANVGSLCLQYREQGSGPPTMVFLHAALGAARQWRSVLAELPSTLRAIAPDLRGHGQSDKPASGQSRVTMAEDVAGLLNVLGIERAYLVGLSLGAAVALQAALDYPEQVEGLILVGSGALNASPQRRTAWFESAQRAYEDAAALRHFMGSVYAQPPGEEELQMVMADARRASYQAWFGRRLEPPPPDLMARLPELRVPCLIVHGRLDRVVPVEFSHQLHAALPLSRLVVWPEHGHFLPQEAPARFARLVTSFVVDGLDGDLGEVA